MESPSGEAPRLKLSAFAKMFPPVSLPVTLGEDTHRYFSQRNQPLPQAAIVHYLLPIEGDTVDEFTEFVPCFQLPDHHDYYGLVYWRAGLLNYQYILVLFDRKTGQLRERRVIAGTTVDDGQITQSVATINEHLTIYIVSGQAGAHTPDDYQPTGSTATRIQVSEKGKLVEL